MKIEIEKIYKLKCGMVAKCRAIDRSGGWSMMEYLGGAKPAKFLDPVDFGLRFCSRSNMYWITSSGLFRGRENDSDFYMHVEKEITP